MKVITNIILLLIVVFWQLNLNAQTEASVSIDTNSILVGDQINLELLFSGPSDFVVEWPNPTDTIISEIEILAKSKIDTVYSEDKNTMYLRQVLRITSFDSGYYAIPPFHFKYKQPGDQLIQFAETEAVLLEVSTLPVDVEQEIKDIKKPIEAPYTFREALPWIIGFILAIAFGYFIYYYFKKRKKAEPVFKVAPKRKLPSHQIALDALENLRYKKVWQSGQIKEYHTELTDIIREYIFGRFNVHALELTSDEIMSAINGTATNDQAKNKLRQTLLLADLVKFAKMQPLPLEHDSSLNNAIDFVKETIHVTTPEIEIDKSVEKTELKEIQETIPEDHKVAETEDGKEVKDV